MSSINRLDRWQSAAPYIAPRSGGIPHSRRKKMAQQVVLITGALTGIGRATAMAFAGKGANVVVSGRHDDKGQALATELRALGGEAELVRADVRKEDDVGHPARKTL